MIHYLQNYFTKEEKRLWGMSVGLILLCFVLFDRENYLSLTASFIGATALIFNAKGNPVGQFLTIVFSLIYGYISYSCQYYGEMITYLGMTAPMALFSFLAWLRHPYNGKKSEVEIHSLKKQEIYFMFFLSSIVTIVFYYILDFFHTANMIPSTLSVTTSFLAVYLTFRRSSYYAVAYAANDLILIVLWVMAMRHDITYISVAICFIMFFANDLYGFMNWKKMEKKQISAG